MDDTTFEYDRSDVTAVADRYPCHRLAPAVGHPGDVTFLAAAPDVLQHAWDEAGRL